MGSATSLLNFRSPSPLRLYARRICLPCTLRAWTHSSIRALRLPSCVTPSLNRFEGGIGFSTDSPSPTPFGLGLGPGLPWADEPSPGNLRLSASRILTCFLAYSCRHSLFLPVHMSLQSCFCPVRTLPYHMEVRGRKSEVGLLTLLCSNSLLGGIVFSLTEHIRFLVLHRSFHLYTPGLSSCLYRPVPRLLNPWHS